MKNILLLFMLSLAVVVNSCKKEETTPGTNGQNNYNNNTSSCYIDTVKDETGDILMICEYSGDKVVKMKRYAGGGTMTEYTTFVYESRKITMTYYETNSTIGQTMVLNLDASGKAISFLMHYGSPGEPGSTLINYEYDNTGLLIKTTTESTMISASDTLRMHGSSSYTWSGGNMVSGTTLSISTFRGTIDTIAENTKYEYYTDQTYVANTPKGVDEIEYKTKNMLKRQRIKTIEAGTEKESIIDYTYTFNTSGRLMSQTRTITPFAGSPPSTDTEYYSYLCN